MAAAKKPAEKQKDSKSRSKGGKSKLGFYTIMVVIGFCAPFMFPTVVLVIIGLFPTIIAFFMDNDRQHSSATSIGAMNFAGITPYVIDLWIRGQSMGTVFQILSEPSTWLVILGAAAIGQIIVSIVPPAMATLTLAHSEMRIKTLKSNLEQLQNSWGPDVGTTKPLDQVRKV